MGKLLTDLDYCKAAKVIGCGTSIMKAVADTESSGAGFLPDGRIKIRFEGHKFKSFTGGQFDQSHPEVSYPYSVQKSKHHGYNEFNIAFGLNPTAAMLATSWGKFQPMGFTHDEAGFDDVHAYVDFLKESEGNQLIAFCRLVKHRGLDDELQRGTLRDCAAFAKGYNGGDYRANQYDTKIYNGKLRYDKNPIDCANLSPFADLADGELLDVPNSAAAVPTSQPAIADLPKSESQDQQLQPPINQNADVINNNAAAEQKPPPSDQPVTVQASKQSLWSLFLAGITTILGWYQVAKADYGDILDKVTGFIDWHFVLNAAVGAGLVGLGLWMYDRSKKRADDRTNALVATAADPSLNTVTVTK